MVRHILLAVRKIKMEPGQEQNEYVWEEYDRKSALPSPSEEAGILGVRGGKLFCAK
jgi:hypothetical protein